MASHSKLILSFFIIVSTLTLHSAIPETQSTVIRAAYWFPDTGFAVSNIDSSLFTHLFCAFADLNPSTYQLTVSSQNSHQFSNFTHLLQENNPSVQTLLSVGGNGASYSTIFASMADQPGSRKSFIDSSIKLARLYNFHGLDLVWKYPFTSKDMDNLGYLVHEWRAAVFDESNASGKTPLLLSAAVYRSPNYYVLKYPSLAIANNLDWINIMAYDFYDPGLAPSETRTTASLYNVYPMQISGDGGVTEWMQSGLDTKQLVFGIPFYGYAWKLLNPHVNGLYSPADGSATSGSSTLGGMAMEYKEIRNFISKNGAETLFNATMVAEFCWAGRTWICYDDIHTVSAKVSYAKQRLLLGYFVWHVGADYNWELSRTAFGSWGS